MGAILLALGCCPGSARANNPGAIIPGNYPVTFTDNGDNTVTLSNGIVSITCFKNFDEINIIKYTFTSGGKTQTVDAINIGSDGRSLYSWGGFVLGSGNKTFR